MKNRYLEKFDKVVMVRVIGSNINGYLSRLINKRIDIIKHYPVSYKECYLIIRYSDYIKLLKYKSIYKISIVRRMGRLRFLDLIKKNKVLILFAFMGIIFLFILSKFVFFIEIIHQDKNIRNLISEELYIHNVRKYTFKKSYDELEKIEDDILNKNKDKLEWIEIIEYGTKYIVRVEERKVNNIGKDNNSYDVVSRKNAVIVSIDAISGEKVKNINDFVRKGEIIISGNIKLPDNSFVRKTAIGLVYGEVWYQVDVNYPFVYQESSYTGRKRRVYVINFFGKEYGVFGFKKYDSFASKNKALLCSNFLNICFVRQEQYEVNVKDEVYTLDIVRDKAINYVRERMTNNNSGIKEFRDVKIISSDSDGKCVKLRLFVKVIEEIGEIVKNGDDIVN